MKVNYNLAVNARIQWANFQSPDFPSLANISLAVVSRHPTGLTLGQEKVSSYTVKNHFKDEKMKGKGYIRAMPFTQNKITAGKRLFLVLV